MSLLSAHCESRQVVRVQSHSLKFKAWKWRVVNPDFLSVVIANTHSLHSYSGTLLWNCSLVCCQKIYVFYSFDDHVQYIQYTRYPWMKEFFHFWVNIICLITDDGINVMWFSMASIGFLTVNTTYNSNMYFWFIPAQVSLNLFLRWLLLLFSVGFYISIVHYATVSVQTADRVIAQKQIMLLSWNNTWIKLFCSAVLDDLYCWEITVQGVWFCGCQRLLTVQCMIRPLKRSLSIHMLFDLKTNVEDIAVQ